MLPGLPHMFDMYRVSLSKSLEGGLPETFNRSQLVPDLIGPGRVMLVWTPQVLSIDGTTTEGWDGDRAAKSLRGTSGSSVTVRFARRSEQVPGVAGRPEIPPRLEFKQARYPSTQPFMGASPGDVGNCRRRVGV